MKSSEMTERIEFYKKDEDKNSTIKDYSNDGYKTYCKTWGKEEYFNSEEQYKAKGFNVLDSTKIIIRYRKDITPKMRFSINADTDMYEVIGKPKPFDKKRFMIVVGERIS